MRLPIFRCQNVRDPPSTNLAVATMIFQNVWNTPWCKVKCVGNLLNGYSRVLTAFTWTAFYSPVFACLFVCFFFLPLEFLNVELLRRKLLLLPSGSPLHGMVQWQESAFYRSAIMSNADLLNTMLLLHEGANAWVRKRRIWIRFLVLCPLTCLQTCTYYFD